MGDHSGMLITLHRTAHLTIDLPPDGAIALFTPEGERRWAAGWTPLYPAPDRREESGAVFTTAHGGRQTTWIIVDHEPTRIRYARVVSEMTAGTVAVEVLASQDDATYLRVTYDLTALTAAGATWLEAFDAEYETEIAAWSTEIEAALGRPRGAALDAAAHDA